MRAGTHLLSLARHTLAAAAPPPLAQGVHGVDDPQWTEKWSDVYHGMDHMQWYSVYGADRPRALPPAEPAHRV